jgi:hypothetical protein
MLRTLTSKVTLSALVLILATIAAALAIGTSVYGIRTSNAVLTYNTIPRIQLNEQFMQSLIPISCEY